MPEAVLAGTNGQPAIDQMTGMPLTMEELLRRRGILSVGGVVSPLNMGGATPVASTASEQALADAAAATSANSTGSGAAIGASPNALDNNGVAVGATPATPALPVDAAAALPPNGGDDSSMWPWLAGGAALAGAAAYGASKIRRNPVTGVDEIVEDGTESAARAMAARRVNPTVNDSLTRVDNERQGSNRRLASTIDGKNVTRANEIGAGPKSLSGTAPVTDVSGDSDLTKAVAGRNGERAIPDYYEPGSRSRTRLETGALQANQSRVLSRGNDPIQLRDRYTDLSPEEMSVAKELAGRRMSDRGAGVGRLPNRIGSTAVRSGNIRAGETLRGSIRAPEGTANQALIEAVAEVRALKRQGFPMTKLLPRVRAVLP